MKKVSILSMLIPSLLSSATTTIHTGWNLLGASKNIDLNETFSKHPEITLVWSYDNEDKDWVVFGNTDAYREIITNNGEYTHIDKLEIERGYWVLSTSTEDVSVDVVEQHDYPTDFLNQDASFTKVGSYVIDDRTGLKWVDNGADPKGTYSEAETYCENLSLEGISDWRVPSQEEFVTLIDWRKRNVAMSYIFDSIDSSGSFWTSDRVTNNYGMNWSVAVYYGQLNQSDRESDIYGHGAVKCVSGDYDFSIEFERDDTKNVVLDKSNGLMWQDDGGKEYVNHSSAESYCDSLTLGGYSDWRLATMKELYSIIDLSRDVRPFVDPTFKNFDFSKATEVWSSTLMANDNSNGWVMAFSSISDPTYRLLTSTSQRAVCIRDNK